MRDLVSLTVGILLGATLTSVVYLASSHRKYQIQQVNTVPIEQCVAALLSR